MNILFELIHNSKLKYDTRYFILRPLIEYVSGLGHNVYLHVKNEYTKNLMGNFSYKTYLDRKHRKKIDLYVGHSVYRQSKDRFNFFHKRGVPHMVYEAGWLHKSLFVDRSKLFGDSYYYNTIRSLVKKSFDKEKAEKFRQSILESTLSKWPQPSVSPIPDIPYIFIPGQVLHDASIMYYSKTGLIPFVEQTIAFAKRNGLHVVYKSHPGLTGGRWHGKKHLTDFISKMLKQHSHFHMVNTSIFDLMKEAKFTACVNAGSIIDNITTLTPVYCCGQSFFSNSGTVVYDPDINRGLTTMLNKEYDTKDMKMQQRRMLWWVYNNLLLEGLTVENNCKRFQKHAGVKLI